ncbi:MAG: hypothetical protein AB7P03_02455 [Kofleriaceae bacterium]
MRTISMCTAIAGLLTAAACSDEGGRLDESEVITTVMLSFAPSTGDPITAEIDDPDGDGGAPPTIDPVNLAATTTYALTVRFQNRLEDPPEEITDEIAQEGQHHLLLFTGSAVVGPATTNASGALTQSYGDVDVNGLPIGLTNTITTATGTGQLIVTLRHMPPEAPPVKSATTLDTVKTSGIDALGGSTDAQVTFDVTVP